MSREGEGESKVALRLPVRTQRVLLDIGRQAEQECLVPEMWEVKSGWGSMKTRMVESRKYRTGWFSKIVRV